MSLDGETQSQCGLCGSYEHGTGKHPHCKNCGRPLHEVKVEGQSQGWVHAHYAPDCSWPETA